MATPDPEAFGLLEKLLAAGAAIVAPLFGLWKFMEGKLDKKADKDDLEELSNRYEQNRLEVREVQIKIFDKLDSVTQQLSRIEGKLER